MSYAVIAMSEAIKTLRVIEDCFDLASLQRQLGENPFLYP
jgi:hypothetical protein